MTTVFGRYEVPVAYSMIAAARRVRPRRDGTHPFQQYFLVWTAFNNIYTTIAHREGRKTRIRQNEDGSVVTIQNGNVNIPKVKPVREREQIYLAVEEFSDDLKRSLINHGSTRFFLERTPFWQGHNIESDAFGQRLNGVINVNYTTDRQYPVWSPIDAQFFEEHLQDPYNQEIIDFLARQIVDLLYTVRNNLLHGGKRFDDANDISVVENALPLLEMIVSSFIR